MTKLFNAAKQFAEFVYNPPELRNTDYSQEANKAYSNQKLIKHQSLTALYS